MRIILVLLIKMFFVLSLLSQDRNFDVYIKCFHEAKLPFSINEQNWQEIFYNTTAYEGISPSLVENFICEMKDSGLNDPSRFRYDYGLKYTLDSLMITYVYKIKYEGLDVYDFDLVEYLLIIYDLQGNILSTTCIAKNNDAWLGNVFVIQKDKILTRQIKIIDDAPKWDNRLPLKCIVENWEYILSSTGKVSCRKLNSFFSRVKYDEENKKWVLLS